MGMARKRIPEYGTKFFDHAHAVGEKIRLPSRSLNADAKHTAARIPSIAITAIVIAGMTHVGTRFSTLTAEFADDCMISAFTVVRARNQYNSSIEELPCAAASGLFAL